MRLRFLFLTVFFGAVLGLKSQKTAISNNYFHLKSNIEQQIDGLSSNKVVFLYIHSNTCHFCKEVAPVIDELTKKYPEALFLKVDIENARNYLKKRYRINGTPNLMLIYKGNIASSQYHIVNSTRGESVKTWANQVYPIMKKLADYNNIDCITGFNYKRLMAGNKYILYRGNARLGNEFIKNMELIYQLAKTHPQLKFGVTSGQIPYGQEVDNKYASVYRRFSIVDNLNVVEKLEPYGASNHTLQDVSSWITNKLRK